MKKSIIIIFLGLFAVFTGIAQQVSSSKSVFMDALCFRGDTANVIDVFVLVPYQILQFDKRGSRFVAEMTISLKVKDVNSKTIKELSESKKVYVDKYEEAQGSTAGFYHKEERFRLAPGNYTIEAIVLDNKSNNTSSKTRKITSIEFDKYPFSISSIMLVSSVEQVNSKYKITPHLSDNISSLDEGFFIFFESYSKENLDSVDYQVRVLNAKNELVYTGERLRKMLPFTTGATVTQRNYVRVALPKKMTSGIYTLKLYAFGKDMPADSEPKDFLASSERSISIERTFASAINDDVDKAIRQLRYVATQAQIEEIQKGSNDDEKRTLFEKFWRSIDPTPTTSLNEAFEEYYARIGYANEKFRSVGEGWMSDKGMVYVIFGAPDFMDRQPRRADGRTAERWTYNSTNRTFTFVDNSGFDDFRLIQPLSSADKYRYSR